MTGDEPYAAPAASAPMNHVCSAPSRTGVASTRARTAPNASSASDVNRIDHIQRVVRVGDEHVRRERKDAAEHVAAADERRAARRGALVGPLEAELVAHHELDPLLAVARDLVDDAREDRLAHAVAVQDLRDLGLLFVRDLLVSRISRAYSLA